MKIANVKIMTAQLILYVLMVSCVSIQGQVHSTKEKEMAEMTTSYSYLYPSDTINIKNHTEWTRGHYPKRIHQFKEAPLKKNCIVMIGNSITEGGKLWNERLGISNVFNRGISGDTSDGVLQRLGEIIWAQPKSVFLLIGVNDFLWSSSSPQKLNSNISLIVEKIKKGSPKTKIYVQTLFPVRNQSEEISSKILKINTLLRDNENLKSYTLIDTYKLLVDADGDLTKAYTNDGIHLTEKGYEVWTKLLSKY